MPENTISGEGLRPLVTPQEKFSKGYGQLQNIELSLFIIVNNQKRRNAFLLRGSAILLLFPAQPFHVLPGMGQKIPYQLHMG